MAFSGHNQAIYNAVFDGCFAGQLAGRQITDATQADYNTIASVATAFATEVDSVVAGDATLTSAGASVVPATAANQANAIAKPHLAFAIAFGYWHGRAPGTDTTAADYLAAANAFNAAYNAAVAAYANAPGGTSLS